MGKKIKVLYEAGLLANGLDNTAGRSGIYFVVYNVLLELLKRKELEVQLYCDVNIINQVKKAISLDKELHNVKIFEYSKLDSLITDWDYLKQQNKTNNGNKIVRVGIKMVLSFLKNRSKLKKLLNLNKSDAALYKNIDVFLSPCHKIPDEIAKIKHITKYNILYDVIPMVFPENYTDMQDKSSWFLKLVNSINKDDYYFAISEYTKQDFIKYIPEITPEHITPIPLSTGLKYERVEEKSQIDKVKEKYNIPQGKKYIFSLCTLEPRKNLVFAIKNFIEFIKRNNIDDFVFVLGGGHWDIFLQKINEAISDLDNFKDKIIKIGYVDDEDMAALYSGADMFVFPSIYEGFGIPILEAMQCGCPVIASSVTSMPEVIGDCGIQIDPTNDEDLIMAFEKMYNDNAFRALCKKQGLERAKEFTWEKCVDVMVKEIIKNEID